jgi:hypothetical protein
MLGRRVFRLYGYPKPVYEQPLFQNKNFMCYAIPNLWTIQMYIVLAERTCYEEAIWILQHAMLVQEDMNEFVEAIKN